MYGSLGSLKANIRSGKFQTVRYGIWCVFFCSQNIREYFLRTKGNAPLYRRVTFYIIYFYYLRYVGNKASRAIKNKKKIKKFDLTYCLEKRYIVICNQQLSRKRARQFKYLIMRANPSKDYPPKLFRFSSDTK